MYNHDQRKAKEQQSKKRRQMRSWRASAGAEKWEDEVDGREEAINRRRYLDNEIFKTSPHQWLKACLHPAINIRYHRTESGPHGIAAGRQVKYGRRKARNGDFRQFGSVTPETEGTCCADCPLVAGSDYIPCGQFVLRAHHTFVLEHTRTCNFRGPLMGNPYLRQ